MKKLSNLIFEQNIDKDDYVDLELQNGTLWAKYNLGADDETDIGEYFAFGETTGYDIEDQHKFNIETYKFYIKNNNFEETFSKYCDKDNKIFLELKDDAATQILNKKWIMPSSKHFTELMNGTNYKWVNNYNDTRINGLLFTSKKNGKTLFFPSSGVVNNDKIEEFDTALTFWTNETCNNIFGGYVDKSFAYGFISWYYKGSRFTSLSPFHKKNGCQIRPIIN